MIKRQWILMITALMLTTPLAGCLHSGEGVTEAEEETESETDPGTDPGTPPSSNTELMELWNTWSAGTSADLPICDANLIGALFYVVADEEFQVCTDTGWLVITIGGSDVGAILNNEPIIELNWDREHQLYPSSEYGGDDGDYLLSLHFFVADFDGTLVDVGLDLDGDLNIDASVLSNLEGTGPIASFSADFDDLTMLSISDDFIQSEYVENKCMPEVSLSISVIAIDDDAGLAVAPLSLSVNEGTMWDTFTYEDDDGVVHVDEQAFLEYFSQSDLDHFLSAYCNGWEVGLYFDEEHISIPDGGSSAQPETLMTLTLDDGYVDFDDIDLSEFFFNVITDGEFRPGYNGILCYATANDDYNPDGCTLVEGTEDGIWSPGETLTIVEGEDAQICVSDGNCGFSVGIFFEGYRNFPEGYAHGEKISDIGLEATDHADSVESDEGLMTLIFSSGADLDWALVQIELADWGVVCDNPGNSGGDCGVVQYGGDDSYHWEPGETLVMSSNGFGFCSADCNMTVEVYYNGNLIASTEVFLT